jgi:CHAT domain-containing protein
LFSYSLGEIGGAPQRFDAATAHALYQALIAPVAATLQGKTQWMVSAGGALGSLPLGVLHTRAQGGAGADAPWLAKEVAIAQIPSLGSWLAFKRLGAARPAPEAFAGWGDPQFKAAQAQTTGDAPNTLETADARTTLRYGDMAPLPETRGELTRIAQALQGDARNVFLGAEASRANVLAQNRAGQLATKRVIAFATHGLKAGELPGLAQPALALSADTNTRADGANALLTLQDVLGLKLNADWVVLSACNTAAGSARADAEAGSATRGEEAFNGLARGFLYAGGRSLLVTHWAVETESAAKITTETLASYAREPAKGKAEALRQAMLKVMNDPKTSHPAFWAAFALVGDGG